MLAVKIYKRKDSNIFCRTKTNLPQNKINKKKPITSKHNNLEANKETKVPKNPSNILVQQKKLITIFPFNFSPLEKHSLVVQCDIKRLEKSSIGSRGTMSTTVMFQRDYLRPVLVCLWTEYSLGAEMHYMNSWTSLFSLISWGKKASWCALRSCYNVNPSAVSWNNWEICFKRALLRWKLKGQHTFWYSVILWIFNNFISNLKVVII